MTVFLRVLAEAPVIQAPCINIKIVVLFTQNGLAGFDQFSDPSHSCNFDYDYDQRAGVW